MKIFKLKSNLSRVLTIKYLRNIIRKLAAFSKKRILAIEAVILLGLILFLLIFNGSILASLLLTSEAVPNFPVKPLSIFGKKVVEEHVEFVSANKKVKAVVYRPDDLKAHPVIIFSVGTGTLAANDVFLGHLSQAMAKVGIIAFVPEVPLLAQEFVLKESIPDYINAFKYVFDQPYARKDKIGFGGFCVGGSLSFIAAADKQISGKIAYLVLISPYFDNLETVKAVVTKTDIKNGQVVPWQPDELSAKVTRNGLLAYLGDTEERKRLQEVLESKKSVNNSEEQFSENAKLIYNTVNVQSREKFEEVVSRYPEGGRRDIELISPKNYVKDLNPNTKIFVLSDKHDTFVPESETLAFRNSVPNIRFTEIDSFEHVRPGTRLPRLAAIKQTLNLFIFLNSVLGAVI